MLLYFGVAQSSNGGSIRNCNESCSGNVSCIYDCEKRRTITAAVIGSVLGFTLLVIAILLCCLVNKKCPLHKYQSLVKKYNQIEPGKMT